MKGRAGDPSVEMERDGKESAISSADHVPARAVARAGPAFDQDSRCAARERKGHDLSIVAGRDLGRAEREEGLTAGQHLGEFVGSLAALGVRFPQTSRNLTL